MSGNLGGRKTPVIQISGEQDKRQRNSKYKRQNRGMCTETGRGPMVSAQKHELSPLERR